MKDKINKNLFLIFGVIVFILLFIFFTRVHALVIFDADDWTYVSQPRSFFPIIGAWNPAKVLPETLMPLCGSISVFLINILVKDYIKSFTIVTAVLISLVIVIYLYSFYNMINKKFKLGNGKSLIITSIFFLMHFTLFYVGETNNQYLFWCHNVNCYYNYLIPNLLCFSIVFTMIGIENKNYSLNRTYTLKSGFVLLLFYMAIFSNLYCNIVLAVYVGAELLIGIVQSIKEKLNINQMIKKYSLLFIILITWLISVVFELTGGRAKVDYNCSFISSIFKCIKNLGYVLIHFINKPILIFSIFLVLISCIIFIKEKILKSNKNYKLLLISSIICVIVITIYYILISAKVSPEYMFKAETLYGLYVYILLFLCLLLCYFVKNKKQINVIILLIVAFLIIETNCSILTYRESNTSNLEPDTCYKIDDYILKKIIDADKKGMTNLDIYVPEYDSSDNWPHATYFGDRISDTLYRHKIINHRIQINVVPSYKVNKKFGM